MSDVMPEKNWVSLTRTQNGNISIISSTLCFIIALRGGELLNSCKMLSAAVTIPGEHVNFNRKYLDEIHSYIPLFSISLTIHMLFLKELDHVNS